MSKKERKKETKDTQIKMLELTCENKRKEWMTNLKRKKIYASRPVKDGETKTKRQKSTCQQGQVKSTKVSQ